MPQWDQEFSILGFTGRDFAKSWDQRSYPSHPVASSKSKQVLIVAGNVAEKSEILVSREFFFIFTSRSRSRAVLISLSLLDKE